MPSKKFSILIDATTVTHHKNGLSQYIISLIAHLPASALQRFDLMVLLNKNIDRPDLQAAIKAQGIKTLVANIATIGPRRDWDMFWFLRRHKHRFHLFHSTSNQYPLLLKNGVATVHDITFKKHFNIPWWSFKLAQRYLHLVMGNATKAATAIIAVSQATQNDLLKTYNPNGTIGPKITVIHEGWEHTKALPANKNSGPGDTNTSPYLFYVGSTRRHKNIFNLLRAFQDAAPLLAQKIDLVLCGDIKNLDKQERKLIAQLNKNEQRVICKGMVPEAALENLYQNADAVIFPSLSEGFGIPILEAFYFNKPLLCSNTSSFPEIAGDAALYFNPHDTADIAQAIRHFYSHPTIAAELSAKGQERLQHFSWNKMAQETVAVYEKTEQYQQFLNLQKQ
jgi:glycosyltransferase involved in cell wall biosynthesis